MTRWRLTLTLLPALLLPGGVLTAQEARFTNPYRNLLYEDPFESAERSSPLHPPAWFEASGQFRMRLDRVGNLDLDRGALPTSGLTVAGTDPSLGGDYATADLRFLFAPVIHINSELLIRSRIVLLENLVLGSTPASYPASGDLPMAAGSTTQLPPRAGINGYSDSLLVSALQLEWLSPLGLLLAGRTTGDWGLGMVANSGTCADCDSLQSVDRIGLVTSLLGALIALSFDFDANGGHAGSWHSGAGLLHDLSDRDDLRTVNLAVSRYLLPGAAARLIRSGRTLVNWGVAASFRWQEEDLPGYYLTPVDRWSGQATADEFVARGLKAVLADGWFRVAHGNLLVEGEAAWLHSTIESASLLAGVATSEVTADQFGGLLRLRWRPAGGPVTLGAEGGIASGDEAYGFGANPGRGYEPQAGDLDGNQISFNGPNPDLALNNFRFNENFHVDELLWRRIVGTVTDGIYGKGRVAVRPFEWAELSSELIFSRTLHAQSAPGLARNLGVEADVGAAFEIAHGFSFRLIGAGLWPLEGFRNLNVLPARDPAFAWLVRGRLEASF